MDGRDWNLFLLPYEQAVEELKVKFRTLRSELKTRQSYAPIEFVTGRVKRISSILEKAKRLNVPMDRLEEGIEDIAGIRIMCQFVDDIYRVVDLIHQRDDMEVIEERDYIQNAKPSGYRSYHMVVAYTVYMPEGSKRLLAEIQIRTLAMNFWATVEHTLNYKYQGVYPEDISERLKRTAEAAYQLDEEMSSIRNEVKEAQKLFTKNKGKEKS